MYIQSHQSRGGVHGVNLQSPRTIYTVPYIPPRPRGLNTVPYGLIRFYGPGLNPSFTRAPLKIIGELSFVCSMGLGLNAETLAPK